MKEALFGKTLNELITVTKEAGLPGFTAHQIADWLYKKGVREIEGMTNLSKKARGYLEERFESGLRSHIAVEASEDGTKKYLFPAGDKGTVEAAWIPESNRSTLCISTQVGCRMGCRFCMTGMQGFQGNLSVTEILNQVESLPEKDLLTNIVYMGMGEPLDNTESVLKSIDILTAEWGYAMSPRRITLSSIGLKDSVRRFLDESQAHLAISLHSPFAEERHNLMPAETAHPVKEIIDLIREYDWSGQRRISFEYIMFKDINDRDNDIRGLLKLLNGLHCRVNLIRFHTVPGTPYITSPGERITEFRDRLTAGGIITTIRASRGEDIHAACGLLSTRLKSEG